MKWLRLYNDTITDPKWRVVAAESGQPLTAVLAVWMSMLINASDADERGTLQGWDDRFAGAALDLRGDAVRAIREAMQGVVLDGMRLTGWDKRQRVSDDIATRVKRHRDKAETQPPGGGTTNGTGAQRNDTKAECNGDVTLQKRDANKNPLNLSSLPTPTLNNEGGGGRGRAHEVAVLVGGLTGLTATKANVATVEEWLAKSYHPQQDIYPAVVEALPTATGAIGCFAYFTKAIDRRHVTRTSPQPEPSNVLPIRHAGSGKKQSGEGSLCSRIALGLA
jgi:hypothetical protein